MTALAGDGGDDVADQVVQPGDVLDTRPAAEAQVVQSYGTVVGGEGTAVDFAIGEGGVEAGGGGRAAGAAGRASRRRGGGRGAGGRGAGRGHGGGGRGLDELGGSHGRRGGLGSGGGGGAGQAGAGVDGRSSVGVLVVTGLDTLAHLGGGEGLSIHHVLDDGVVDGGQNITLLVVTVGVALVALGGHEGARGGQGESNRVELHGVGSSAGNWFRLYPGLDPEIQQLAYISQLIDGIGWYSQGQ